MLQMKFLLQAVCNGPQTRVQVVIMIYRAIEEIPPAVIYVLFVRLCDSRSRRHYVFRLSIRPYIRASRSLSCTRHRKEQLEGNFVLA